MFRFAVSNLLSRKTRTALALLGLTVAIVGMVGLFSVVEGLERVSEEAFARIPGLIVMQTGAPVPLFSRLPADWENELKRVEGVKIVSPEIWSRVNVIDGVLAVNPPRFLFGVDIPTWNALDRSLYRDDIIEGRFLNEDDRGTNHAVVSRWIQEELQLQLNETFTVNGDEATLVGVYETGSILIDVSILMDIDVVRRRSRFDRGSVSAYYIETDGDNAAVIERIEALFRHRDVDPWRPTSLPGEPIENPVRSLLHQFDRLLKSGRPAESPDDTAENVTDEAAPPSPPHREPGEPNEPSSSESLARPAAVEDEMRVDETSPVEVQSAEQWSARFDQLTGQLDIIMVVLAGIGLTIAAFGVANTMLMSVSERIIEIGILKANGWSRKHVLSLIAYESGLLGFVGGCLGSGLGWIGTLIINANFSDQVSLYAGPGLIVFSVVFSTVLGLLAGLYPAVWAMRLMPMEAIRRG